MKVKTRFVERIYVEHRVGFQRSVVVFVRNRGEYIRTGGPAWTYLTKNNKAVARLAEMVAEGSLRISKSYFAPHYVGVVLERRIP